VALLLARTHYSLLTAPASPRVLCEEAVRCGLSHLALADTNALYGLWPFAQEAARLGLRAVFGSELVVGGRRLVALARDRAGYRSLCALLSERNGVAGEQPFDLARACERHAEGLWIVCSDVRLLPELSVRLGPETLRVGLPPRTGAPSRAVDLDAPEASEPATGRKLPDPAPGWPRQQLVEVARDLDLTLCAVRDVWFPRPEDRALHQLFLAVKWNRGLRGGDADVDLRGIAQAPPWACLPPAAQQRDGFDDQPAALHAAEEVLASCTLAFPSRAQPIFPPVELPAGATAADELRRLAFAGLRARCGDAPAARDRCERELAVIERMGFAPYFLAVASIAGMARARGIPCLGRGSAADSLVSYCLGLTDADPLRHGLLFERFLNAERGDLPDIDLDFCWRRRDELIDAVYERFGRDRVARIATYTTCGPRAAYQEAAKALGLPPAEAARRSKLLPWQDRPDLDLAEVVGRTPGFYARGKAGERGEPAGPGEGDLLPPARERLLVALAQRLLAAPRHLGVHPGGVVITPDPIARHAPLERAAKGVVVTQYDMQFVEALGMVKIDLLGNRALSIVADTAAMAAAHGAAVPDLEQIAEDDVRAVALLRQGRTLGCFQIESPAMRQLLQQMAADSQERVIQAIALVRPGPAASGMKEAFVRRVRGLEPASAPHPLLAAAFADTFGIMLYQEDVIRAAMAVAGMDATAGDTLRRRLGKRGGVGPAEVDAFVVAGLRRGLPRAAIEQAWAEMARFAGYSFCKAHAVSYGRLSWRCLWLKARWPAAFLAAVLRHEAGYFAPGVYAEDAKRFGATLRPPCVQQGGDDHELLDLDTVRIGLRHVRGVSARAVEAILAARQAGGPFRSFAELLRRARPARDEAEALVQVGACDAFGQTRPELLWRLQVASAPHGVRAARAAAAATNDVLFADAVAPREVAYPPLPDFDAVRRAEAELRLLGFTLAHHPVDVLWRRGALPVLGRCVPCGRLGERLGATVLVCGFAVAFRGHRTEVGGMCFVTLEDGTGIIEATLFPATWQRCGGLLQGRGPYVVKGVVEERLGGIGLRALDVSLPDAPTVGACAADGSPSDGPWSDGP
jgi:DNA-directed DNA polymerase III PolC